MFVLADCGMPPKQAHEGVNCLLGKPRGSLRICHSCHATSRGDLCDDRRASDLQKGKEDRWQLWVPGHQVLATLLLEGQKHPVCQKAFSLLLTQTVEWLLNLGEACFLLLKVTLSTEALPCLVTLPHPRRPDELGIGWQDDWSWHAGVT